MKSKIKNLLQIFGSLGIILGVGAVLILVFGGFSYLVQWLWALVPFGLSGFFLGGLIICVTYFFARQVFPERKLGLNFDSISDLGFIEIIAYLYGSVIIFASLLWFVVPDEILRILPSFGSILGFSLLAVLLIYGSGGCLAAAVNGLKVYVWGSVFFGLCGLFCLWFINMPIWNFTESVPPDFYFLGKIIFVFILFLQILYLIFLHIIPAWQSKEEIAAEQKKTL